MPVRLQCGSAFRLLGLNHGIIISLFIEQACPFGMIRLSHLIQRLFIFNLLWLFKEFCRDERFKMLSKITLKLTFLLFQICHRDLWRRLLYHVVRGWSEQTLSLPFLCSINAFWFLSRRGFNLILHRILFTFLIDLAQAYPVDVLWCCNGWCCEGVTIIIVIIAIIVQSLKCRSFAPL